MPSPRFLALDWGTTNLRAWVVADDGTAGERRDFPLGVSKLAPGEAARRFREDVRPALNAEALPALLCGMVGSNLGWAQVPYCDAPAGLDDLALRLHRIEGETPPVAIVPGLRGVRPDGAPDVMRGEETQVLGWIALDPARSRGVHVVCHPGTHAKWVLVKDGRIERFVTAMTGELFDVLRKHSVLGGAEGEDDESAFDAGVDAAGDGAALASRLFTARARVVGGGGLAPGQVKSYLSGLLIGAEAAATPALLGAPADAPLALLGDPML
ncbi:MAG: 2-dehydro-3-deoxygalactonokinase, partial [Caulobacteraceae bacterium]